MNASRALIRHGATALAAALCCSWAQASEIPAGPWPLARETPAFTAPEDPPDGSDPEQPFREQASSLTLAGALANALLYSPDLAQYSWEIRASEARALQAAAIPNPEIDYRLTDLSDIPTDREDSRQRIMLSQVLELGGKRRRRHELAQAQRRLSDWRYEAMRLEVATAVATSYAEVVGAQRRLEILERWVGFHDDLRVRVRKLVELGSIGSVELHRVARIAGETRIELETARAELSAARHRLTAIWGNPSPRFSFAEGELGPVLTPPPLETVRDLAKGGPAVARWDAEADRGEAALELARAERVPDLTYGAGIRWEDSIDDRGYLVDVEIAIPVFDRKKGQIREAQFDIARARAARRAAEASSAARIAEAHAGLVASAARVILMRDEVLPAAQATHDALQQAFDSRAVDHDDLLDARRDLVRAEVDLVEALVEHHAAIAALEGLVGESLQER